MAMRSGRTKAMSQPFLPMSSILEQAASAVPAAGSSTSVQSRETGDTTTVTVLDRGVLLLEPDGPSAESLVVSVGIHGNETAPMELVDGLVANILAGTQRVGCRLLVIVGNPEAAIVQRRFVEHNLNRLFSGTHRTSGTAEAKRAERLEDHVVAFFGGAGGADGGGGQLAHLDLHTAIRRSKRERFAIAPFGSALSTTSEYFLLTADVGTVVQMSGPSTTFSYFTSVFCGADSLTIELGRVRPRGENDLSELAVFEVALRSRVAGRSPAHGRVEDGLELEVFEVADEILRHVEHGFTLNLDEDVPNFTELAVGHQLTSGPPEAEAGGYRLDEPGLAVVFPNPHVPVGQRVALVVRRI